MNYNYQDTQPFNKFNFYILKKFKCFSIPSKEDDSNFKLTSQDDQLSEAFLCRSGNFSEPYLTVRQTMLRCFPEDKEQIKEGLFL